jgi:phosphoribosylanthranilate isomerase
VGVEVKFCGLTRPADVAEAVRLGANYVGVVFAGGPRRLTVEAGAALLAGVPETVRRVGVFGRAAPADVADAAHLAERDVVQLHGDPTPADVDAVRRSFEGEVWGVVRLDGAFPPDFDRLAAASDAVLLDARVPGVLGGSGVALDWERAARGLEGRRTGRVVLAGGLTPENVASAVALFGPDAVDVSSGVESAPGVKDHARMRAFVGALRVPGAV